MTCRAGPLATWDVHKWLSRNAAAMKLIYARLETARDAIQFLVEGRLGLGLDARARELDAGALGRRLRRLAREGAAVSCRALRG